MADKEHAVSISAAAAVCQISGAGAGGVMSLQNASANTPAKAVINHGADRVTFSGTLEQTSPAEHASPRMKPGRKRRANEEVSATVIRGEIDNVTVVNYSSMAPSGRGEVGGSMIPAAGEAVLPSCFGDSVAAAGPAGSQLDASVHMTRKPSTLQDSESNREAQGEQHDDLADEQPRRGRGRPRGSRNKARVEGSASFMSPTDGAMEGSDGTVRRGRGRPKGSTKKKIHVAADNDSGAAENENEDENDLESSGGASGEEDQLGAASPDDAQRRRRGRPRLGKATHRSAAEGCGATEQATTGEFAEPHKKRQRGRPPKAKATEHNMDQAQAQIPEGSTVNPCPGASTVNPCPGASTAEAIGATADGPVASAAGHCSGAVDDYRTMENGSSGAGSGDGKEGGEEHVCNKEGSGAGGAC